MYSKSSKIDIAREASFRILCSCLIHKKNIDNAFELLREYDTSTTAITVQDRSFIKNLVMTTLRHRGGLVRVIRSFMQRKLPLKFVNIEIIMMMGAAQILLMDSVPDYAAVSSSVDIAKTQKSARGHCKLVNALLKKVAKNKEDILAKTDFAKYSLPRWLRMRWEKQYGKEHTERIGKAVMLTPAIDITLKPDCDSELWASPSHLDAVILPTGSLRLSGDRGRGSIKSLAGYEEGCWWVQDAASSLPVKILQHYYLANISDKGIAGCNILDMCAAPGGKTAQLASYGANVTAIDRSERRLLRLRENVTRLQLQDKVRVICSDVLEYFPAVGASTTIASDICNADDATLYDAILLDAPCSATGTLRRHPDIGWTRSQKDVEELAELQIRLLHHAVSLLRDNGVLIYCTCSMEREECEEVISWFFAGEERSHMRLAKITQQMARELGIPEDAVTKTGMLRVLPYHMADYGGMDGFFVAMLHKQRK